VFNGHKMVIFEYSFILTFATFGTLLTGVFSLHRHRNYSDQMCMTVSDGY